MRAPDLAGLLHVMIINYAGHHFTASGDSGAAPGWKLQAGGRSGQTELAGLVQYITHRRSCTLPRPVVILHPWQADPPLPSRFKLSLTSHITSPGVCQHRRDGRLYKATGGSG